MPTKLKPENEYPEFAAVEDAAGCLKLSEILRDDAIRKFQEARDHLDLATSIYEQDEAKYLEARRRLTMARASDACQWED